MAAASVDLPAVVVPGGPMLTGTFRGTALGCGTDVWRLSEEVRGGNLSEQDFLESESSMIRSRGHCNTMGTASTMACMAEALGTTIPGIAGTPAPDSRLLETAHASGRLAVAMVEQGLRPSVQLSRAIVSATRSSRWRPSADPRTRSCTCWRSPAGSASTCRWTTSTRSGRACRCWSTCSRPGGT